MAISTIGSAGLAVGGVGRSNMYTGAILQVVNSTSTSTAYTTSSSYSTTNLYATITPSSTSSKILILATSRNVYYQAQGLQVSIYRGTSGNGSGSSIAQVGNASNTSGNFYLGGSLTYLDSPASTSALTYTIMHLSTNGSTLVGFIGELSGTSSITLLEVSA